MYTLKAPVVLKARRGVFHPNMTGLFNMYMLLKPHPSQCQVKIIPNEGVSDDVKEPESIKGYIYIYETQTVYNF